MSAMNPSKDLDKVIVFARAGHIPEDAERWAEGAYRTTEGILETMSAMRKNGVPAPTFAQREALANICAAARRWIKAAKEKAARASETDAAE
ncbi:MAG TPA: hypothetical protein VEL76_18180 [Gemmataceae bacterium]|nr:hypothetical protein [Gemmataceae bacterium]